MFQVNISNDEICERILIGFAILLVAALLGGLAFGHCQPKRQIPGQSTRWNLKAGFSSMRVKDFLNSRQNKKDPSVSFLS